MSKEGCQCFTCQHHDRLDLCAAYYQGYVEACDWFLHWAKRNNIPEGHIADDDLPGIVAQIRCNRDESECLLQDVKRLIDEETRKNSDK